MADLLDPILKAGFSAASPIDRKCYIFSAEGDETLYTDELQALKALSEGGSLVLWNGPDINISFCFVKSNGQDFSFAPVILSIDSAHLRAEAPYRDALVNVVHKWFELACSRSESLFGFATYTNFCDVCDRVRWTYREVDRFGLSSAVYWRTYLPQSIVERGPWLGYLADAGGRITHLANGVIASFAESPWSVSDAKMTSVNEGWFKLWSSTMSSTALPT